MTRDATAASLTESQLASGAKPFILAELDFPDGFIRANTTDRSVFFDSQGGGDEEFFGVGNLGAVSAVGEGSSLQAEGVELTLTGIPGTLISAAFQNARGRRGTIWVGFFDDNYVLVADPVLVFEGLIDNSSIKVGDTLTVTLLVESRLITWERPKIQRYTNEAQQLRFPGDKFLEFVNQMVEKELLWGIAGDGTPVVQTVSTSTPIGTGGRGNESGILIRPDVAPDFEGRGVEGGTRVIKEGGP